VWRYSSTRSTKHSLESAERSTVNRLRSEGMPHVAEGRISCGKCRDSPWYLAGFVGQNGNPRAGWQPVLDGRRVTNPADPGYPCKAAPHSGKPQRVVAILRGRGGRVPGRPGGLPIRRTQRVPLTTCPTWRRAATSGGDSPRSRRARTRVPLKTCSTYCRPSSSRRIDRRGATSVRRPKRRALYWTVNSETAVPIRPGGSDWANSAGVNHAGFW